MSALEPYKPTSVKHSLQTSRHLRSSYNSHNVSLPAINPEETRKSLNELTLKKIVEHNREYLREKVKISNVRKPSRYAYRLPSKTGSSEYNRTFVPSLPSSSLEETTPSRQRMANNLKLPNKQITSQSTYHMDFERKNKELQAVKLRQPQQHQRAEGPFFTETSYARDYPTHERSPPAEKVQPGGNIAVGGRFSEATTYKQFFHESASASPSRAVAKKDHSIFVKVGKARPSNYQESYPVVGAQRVEESCRPAQRLGTGGRMKYKTEYGERYVEQRQEGEGEFSCLNNEELKSYVLSMLNGK